MVVTLAATTLAFAVWTTPAAAETSHMLRGHVALSLPSYSWPANTETCAGPFGTFGGLAKGARVRVIDGSAHVLATAKLGAGSVSSKGSVGTYGTCTFAFRVEVPESRQYAVTVAGHRAAIYTNNSPDRYARNTTTLAAMRRLHWTRRLAIGLVPVGRKLTPG